MPPEMLLRCLRGPSSPPEHRKDAHTVQLQSHRFWLQPLVTWKVLVRQCTRTDIKYSKEKHPFRRNKKNFSTKSKYQLLRRDKYTRIVAHEGLYIAIFNFAVINEDESGIFQNKYSGFARFCTTISKFECDLSLTQRRKVIPAMSRAPSLLDSVPAASSPTKPTFSFFWSACAPGKTPPLRDFCTMTEACGYLLIFNHEAKATMTARVDAGVPAAVRAYARAQKQIG